LQPLNVGGFTPFTNLDFPGRLAAVVFVQGCPWRCGYCHNPHLQPRRRGDLAWTEIQASLRRRRGLLDAVVFSGGEPTLEAGLADAMADVRALGFAVGLHTAGMYPRRLAAVLPLVDWVGFDLKAPLDDRGLHDQVVGVTGGARAVRASLQMLLESGVACEFRTTAHPAVLPDDALVRIAEQLAARGVARHVVQVARPVAGAAGMLERVGPDYPAQATLARLRSLCPDFVLRRD
jgi:pyruvate formate lyase activating enzyme